MEFQALRQKARGNWAGTLPETKPREKHLFCVSSRTFWVAHSGGLALPLQEKLCSVPQRTWVGTISIICPVFISFLLLAPRKRQSSLTAHCFFNRKTSSLLSKYGHRVFF